MDKIEKYQRLLREFFIEQAAIQDRQNNGLKAHLVVNGSKTDFLLLKMGWRSNMFVHAVTFHIEIKREQVWIYENKVDIDLPGILVKAGVAKKDIVLGFLSPTLRTYTEYGVGESEEQLASLK